MPVINGVYTKDFPSLGRALADSDIIVVAIPGDNVTYKTTYGALKTYINLANLVPYTGATGDVDLGTHSLSAESITLDPTPATIPTAQGSLYFDDDELTLAVVLNGTVQKVGEDVFFQIKNQSGSTIPKGTAVRFDGVVGGSGRIKAVPFLADGTYPSIYFLGITSEEILDGGDGKAYMTGKIRGINTNAYAIGTILYCSTTVAGGYQTTAPVAPNNIISVAAVINQSATVGEILVRPTIGSNINRDEGVLITSPTTGDLLQLQSDGLWKNKTVASLGLVPTSRTLTINGTAYDLSADRTWSVGTVTSVAALTIGTTGTDLSSTVANGTTTPVITLNVPTASATNRGALSSADWTTFNNKQNALTNPVTGTGTTNELAYFTGSTTIASLTTATYPSLTELSYVKGVTSAIQTQLNGKQATLSLTTTGTSGAATLVGSTLNIPNYGSALSGYLPLSGGTLTGKLTFSGINGLYLQSNRNSTDAQFQAWYESNGTTRRGYLGYVEANNALYLYNELASSSLNLGADGSYQIQISASLITLTQALSGTSALFTGGGRFGTSSGNLEVGYSAFQNAYKLDVNGTGRFSGNVSLIQAANPQLNLIGTNSTALPEIYLKRNTSTVVGYVGAGINSTFDNVGDYFAFENRISTGGIILRTNSINALTIASTGAATFSSSVTTGAGANITGKTNSSGANYWELGTDTDGYYINALNRSSGNYNKPAYIDAQKLIINSGSGGNVGINTTSPDASLTVKSIETAAKGISIWGRSDSIGTLRFFNSTGATEQGGLISTSTYLGFIYADTERMRIFSGGNVFIGSSPSDAGYKLDVNGTGRFSGNGTSRILSSLGDNNALIIQNTAASPYGVEISFPNASPNDTTRHFLRLADSSGTKAIIYSSGAATFSSSVTADSYLVSASDARIRNTDATGRIVIGNSTTSTYGIFYGASHTTLANNFVIATNSANALTINASQAATFSSSVTATGFFESSSILLKDIISRDGDVAYFKWKDKQDDKIHIGYIAEEVQLTNPDQVNSEGEYLAVNYIELLVQKVRDLEKRIKQLENA